MPVPQPHAGETEAAFVSRFMASPAMRAEFPRQDQRAAVAHRTWRSLGRRTRTREGSRAEAYAAANRSARRARRR